MSRRGHGRVARHDFARQDTGAFCPSSRTGISSNWSLTRSLRLTRPSQANGNHSKPASWKMHAEPSSFDGNNTDWSRLGGGVGGVQLCRLGSLGLARFLVRFLLTLGHDVSFGGWRSRTRKHGAWKKSGSTSDRLDDRSPCIRAEPSRGNVSYFAAYSPGRARKCSCANARAAAAVLNNSS